MNTTKYWSRLPGFFGLDVTQRRKLLESLPLSLSDADFAALDRGLSFSLADAMSENVIGRFDLPLSCAANFIVDSKPVVVPMAIEEPSIVAACSKMAKLTAENGGFFTSVEPSFIKGQIQFFDVGDTDKALAQFARHKEQLLAHAQRLCPRMQERGGGVVDITIRVVPSQKIGPMVLVEPLINVVDAMGANVVNTIVEGLSVEVAKFIEGQRGIRILSNLCDQRRATAAVTLRFDQLATDDQRDDGALIAERLYAAHAFAEADIYRACTHNKGILNGVDAVAIATGNDFRAIEAGAHAYASQSGVYQPLTSLEICETTRRVKASLTLPLAIGVVGGLAGLHPGVKISHALLGEFSTNSQKLAAVMVSVGLSQCLAALVALCQDGIQKGHMKLHKRKLMCSAEHAENHSYL